MPAMTDHVATDDFAAACPLAPLQTCARRYVVALQGVCAVCRALATAGLGLGASGQISRVGGAD
jgi:hypothetical protein